MVCICMKTDGPRQEKMYMFVQICPLNERVMSAKEQSHFVKGNGYIW